MKKLLYVLASYPQISETYMETEIRALDGRFEIQILTPGKFDLTYEWHHPYRAVKDIDEMIAAAREFRPDIIHGHYTTMIPPIAAVAAALDVPFTIRSHSFDVLGPAAARLATYRDAVNSALCAGVLGFPPTLELFARAGWDMGKVVSCYPIIEYEWFYDRSPNGDAIMNLGACIPKKRMEDFVRLGARMPEKRFNLYALGYSRARIEQLNDSLGGPVNMIQPIEPKLMPAEYKKHEWLVYTGNPELPTVGWPLAVAEAQAAGVGVCMQRVRPDLEEYLGGAGYLFDTLDEAAAIISRPVPADVRERGFTQAKKSDIHTHVESLLGLWRAAYRISAPPPLPSRRSPSRQQCTKVPEPFQRAATIAPIFGGDECSSTSNSIDVVLTTDRHPADAVTRRAAEPGRDHRDRPEPAPPYAWLRARSNVDVGADVPGGGAV